jgi:hypothetical protein
MPDDIIKEKLLAVIDTLNPEAHKMLAPKFFADRAGISLTPEIAEVLYEISMEDRRLERWAMLFEFDDEHNIEEEDLAHFDKTGELVHPHSGKLIPNAAEHLSIYYAYRKPEPEQPSPS